MRTINYVIPEMDSDGGIQTFAKDSLSSLSLTKKYRAIAINWDYTILNLALRGAIRYSPEVISSQLYARFAKPKLMKAFPTIKGLSHFWGIESSIPNKNKQFVISIHGLDIMPKNLRGFRYRAYYNKLLSASAIHANSNYTKRLILNTFPKLNHKNIFVIPPMVARQKTVSRNSNKKVVIGTLSRFVDRKNIVAVIRALNILYERNEISFTYHLAGTGPEKEKILDELSNAKFKWKYFGRLTDHDKNTKFFPKLDMFVMPVKDAVDDVEGFGIVYIEANSFGVPVIASDTGGISDAVKEGESGVFADPSDTEDISNKIVEVHKRLDLFKKKSLIWSRRFDDRTLSKNLEEMYDYAFGKK